MTTAEAGFQPLAAPLYAAAAARSFTSALTGVLLGLYLAEMGSGAAELGVIVGAGLAGMALGTTWVAWHGDRVGRWPTLIAATVLSGLGLVGLAAFEAGPLLPAIAFAGMLNGMGRDRGPAQTLEQSILADAVPGANRTAVFARYALAQDVAGALGSLAAGAPKLLEALWSLGPASAYRWTFAGAAAVALLPVAIYARLAVPEQGPAGVTHASGRFAPLSPGARRRVGGLSALFALDSLGGGLLAGSIVSYWFFRRFNVAGDVLGPVFFAARALNALSYLAADGLARRIGLVRTMVFTHLPSSALLIVLPLVPSAPWAILLFLAREALVQMDVPTRQSYVAAVTSPGERTFALGVTGVVRNAGWALGAPLAGLLTRIAGLGAPLVAGAALKMAYDVALYYSFRGIQLREEQH
ncbi:MAG: MFS transporter [Gemmatimonadetes bacterium]|nr:MFS transporter [Gemmatimonadota bacterium]